MLARKVSGNIVSPVSFFKKREVPSTVLSRLRLDLPFDVMRMFLKQFL